jgi:uncharacterized membrane protein
MILLIAGLLAFACVHLVSAFPRHEEYWRIRLGRYYRPLFGLLLLLSLAIVVIGWRLSPFIPVYQPPVWGRYAAFLLVLLAFFGLGIFLFRGKLRQMLRFPLAIGIILWAIGHLLANGDAASLVLFGGMMSYAAIYAAFALINGIRPSPDIRAGHDTLSIIIGAALYGAMTQLHPIVIGVPILDLGSWVGTG